MVEHAIDCAKWDVMDSGKPFIRHDWPCSCKPQWTTTPPDEPGWYWWRDLSHQLEQRPIELPVEYINPLAGGEWWPERIPEPTK